MEVDPKGDLEPRDRRLVDVELMDKHGINDRDGVALEADSLSIQLCPARWVALAEGRVECAGAQGRAHRSGAR